MHTYKIICLLIIITIFVGSLYSKGYIEKEWNPMRWKVNSTTIKLPASSTFEIPSSGDTFVLECINYSDLRVVEISDDHSKENGIGNQNQVGSWYQIKQQRNQILLSVYPNEETQERRVHLIVKSRQTQQIFVFCQQEKTL